MYKGVASCLGFYAKEFKCTGRPNGQATMELLAACSMARHPADIVLTDSFKYNILRLQGQRLIFWADLPPETALVVIADMMRQVNLSFLSFPLSRSAY